jgi:hypothetical protein
VGVAESWKETIWKFDGCKEESKQSTNHYLQEPKLTFLRSSSSSSISRGVPRLTEG